MTPPKEHKPVIKREKEHFIQLLRARRLPKAIRIKPLELVLLTGISQADSKGRQPAIKKVLCDHNEIKSSYKVVLVTVLFVSNCQTLYSLDTSGGFPTLG